MKLPLLLPARLILASVVLAAGDAFAELPTAPIRESEQKQAQIQGETKLLSDTLTAMLGEYERNNLAGDDAATVRKLRESLGALSSTEMRQVVDLLQRARAASDPNATVRTVADAFTTQKQILVAIQRILAEHAREQEAAEISKQLHALADRQARNLRNAIELGRMTAGGQAENAGAMQQAQLETQRGEQSAIAEELKMIRGKVARFAANPENAGAADNFNAAAKQLEAVEPVAEAAAEALKAGQLFKAATDEKASREELRKVARQIAPREQGPEALRKAERELGEVIAEQRQLRDSTAGQRKQQDLDKWLAEKLAGEGKNDALPSKFRNQPASALRENPEIRARFENEERAQEAQLARIEDQQGELASKTDALAQKIAEVPRAAEGLKGATGKMQEARAAMQDANAPQAAQQQDAALARLDTAHAELKRRADEAEALAARSDDKVKDLEQLKNVAEALAREEGAVAKEAKPDAAAQADIARRANQLAQRAAAAAPLAAQPAQAAANNAQQAEQAMQAGKPAEGRAAAEQAAQNLAEAAKQIAQELAKAQAAQQQADAAQAALADLGKLIQAEQTLELETAKAVALVSQKMPAPFAELGTRQGAVQADAANFRGTLTAMAPDAGQAVGDAAMAMGDARVQLDAAKGAEARVAEQRAIERLLAAQHLLGAMLDQAQAALGQPNAANAAQMAAAANQLAQAQQQVQQAQANLQQAAQQSGQQAAQNAAEAAQQAAQAAQQAAQAAQAAQQQAAQAGNQPAAQQAAQAAQQAAAAAQAAQQAAQNAQQMAANPGQPAAQAAQEAAQQSGQAAQAAQQAATAAQAAQQAAQQGAQQAAQAGQQAAQNANQQAAQQAGQAAQAAQQAAQAAQQAQQMAQAAAQAAQNGSQTANASMQQAAQQLAQAAQSAGQAAAQQGGRMSPSAQQATQQAGQQLSSATGQAMSGQNSAAQQAAQSASQSLAKAQAAMAATQAGLSASQGAPMPGGQGQPGQGSQPGQGQAPGKNSQAGTGPSQGAESYTPGDPKAVERGAREAALKKADFIGLPARERAAIQQSLREKYPQEYGPLVEQYLLNLANESGKK